MPSCENSAAPLSKAHSAPEGCFSSLSDVNHSAARTFTTNQPSATGARPEPESSSLASGTARVYSRVYASAPESQAVRNAGANRRIELRSRAAFDLEASAPDAGDRGGAAGTP